MLERSLLAASGRRLYHPAATTRLTARGMPYRLCNEAREDA
jgi:hypothetical protein